MFLYNHQGRENFSARFFLGPLPDYFVSVYMLQRNILSAKVATPTLGAEPPVICAKHQAHSARLEGAASFNYSAGQTRKIFGTFSRRLPNALSILCTAVILYVRAMVENRQAVSTFGLAYLSAKQMELPNQCEIITVFRDDTEIVRQVAAHYEGFVRFVSWKHTPPLTQRAKGAFFFQTCCTTPNCSNWFAVAPECVLGLLAADLGLLSSLPPEVPMTVQERAYTSPIWHTPAN